MKKLIENLETLAQDCRFDLKQDWVTEEERREMVLDIMKLESAIANLQQIQNSERILNNITF